MKSKLIVFEGIDGVGKSTQINYLVDNLKHIGIDISISKEPTNSRYGIMIKKSLFKKRLSRSKEIELFEADRLHHISNFIIPNLNSGLNILLDRYYYSTAAYQSNNDMEMNNILYRNETFCVKPDLVFLFDLDPKLSLNRIDKKDSYEDSDLNKVRENYLKIYDMNKDIFIRIDSSKKIESISKEIMFHVKKLC